MFELACGSTDTGSLRSGRESAAKSTLYALRSVIPHARLGRCPPLPSVPRPVCYAVRALFGPGRHGRLQQPECPMFDALRAIRPLSV